ncbi:PepSY-associated TM helix domain-containing protein [Cupriavidus sp. TA19]|uniref:PepSY-associated TM helix domain-containing protein n=1 Tax=Cupriavidus sp. TA19 TaxID=701108 RepID=UPI00295E9D16|nr:PepSY-associated TM helix domain-containing protein [Cupriavidus sp. TA19]
MRTGFRQSMAWLHTWTGLLVCWVLLLMFCGGTASYFKDEISLWMRPELHRSAAAASKVPAAQATEGAVRYLNSAAPDATRWFISLPDERQPYTSVLWVYQPGKGPSDAQGKPRRFDTRLLDPVTGAPLQAARETRGGEFLYRLHFDLHYMPAKWARWIAGFCAMFMLVAIVSGVITHRRIFADFFTFRRSKGQRSWLDAHNALAVLALPFHLMITYTGLVTLLFMYMPWGIEAAYRGDQRAFQAEAMQRPPQRKPAGTPAELAPVGAMVAQAQQRWQGAEPQRVVVSLPGDANATVSVIRAEPRALAHDAPTLEFSGKDGTLMQAYADDQPGADLTRSVMTGLHIAGFASPGLRALFFLCGLAGSAMVATGAILWAVRTRQQQARAIAAGARPSFGLRLVEALNIGAIAGLPVAFASYFWANRLLPVEMLQRQETEIRWFFIAWGACALLAQLRPSRAMWRAQLWAGAVLFGGIPLLNALTTDSHLGVTLLQGRGPAAVAGFDLVTLALGIALGAAAWMTGRRQPAARSAPQPRAQARGAKVAAGQEAA